MASRRPYKERDWGLQPAVTSFCFFEDQSTKAFFVILVSSFDQGSISSLIICEFSEAKLEQAGRAKSFRCQLMLRASSLTQGRVKGVSSDRIQSEFPKLYAFDRSTFALHDMKEYSHLQFPIVIQCDTPMMHFRWSRFHQRFGEANSFKKKPATFLFEKGN